MPASKNKNKYKDYKPTSVRLKDLKAPLMEEAFDKGKSINKVIIEIITLSPVIQDYIKNKKAQI